MGETRRVALVTGGARRVGRAIVERLAAEGFDVALTYLHSEADARDAVAAIHRRGARGLAIRADLTDPATAANTIQEQMDAWSDRLDVLVYSASVYEPGSLQTTTAEQVRRAFAVHVESPLLLCRAFEAKLRAARASVVVMTDVLADQPWPDYLAYCASKAALTNLMKGLALELAPEVTANAVAPSVVEWPEDRDEIYRQRYLRRIALGRPGTPGDVAGMVHFLCTRGKYITGQTLRVDGGYSIT